MKKFIFNILILGTLSSCNYLDVVPDNVATLDYAFRNRASAQRYLATCYSKLPNFYDPFGGNVGLVGADELYINNNDIGNTNATLIALGQQTKNGVLVDYWSGNAGGVNLWQGIRDCNIFLENIDKVVEMSADEKSTWKGEVIFLKAFYHFYLLKSYGAIPIVDVNESVDISPEEVQNITREPSDKVFAYIVSLLDEAIQILPDQVLSPNEEMGRITKPIAMAMKGKVLLYHASPLFNGNTDYANFKNSRNETLFNPSYDATRWEKAATALEEAIEYAHSLGYQLHYFQPTPGLNISAGTIKELDLRTAITERWNSEIIWGDPVNVNNSASARLQIGSIPRFEVNYSGAIRPHGVGSSYLGVTLNHIERFYSSNGVPIEEDVTFDYDNIYSTPVAPSGLNTQYITTGHKTSPINLNREPRFYAYLAFDGNLYFGQDARTDATRKNLIARDLHSNANRTSLTGYNPKKMVNYMSSINDGTTLVQESYPFPVIRLADLYLMYAEAANEAYGPSSKIYEYINLIRERAGLQSVQQSWTNYSRFPDKYLTKDGMRDIIRRERTIELSFEGSRFWDLRRWKTAHFELNQTIRGWNVFTDVVNAYYTPMVLNSQKFELKHYFWPIRVNEMIKSPNIIQSPGW